MPGAGLAWQLRFDDPISADHDRCGVGYAVSLPAGLFVAKAKCVDRFALRVREERKFQLCLVGEAFEDVNRIVTDAHNLESRVLDLFQVLLQLYQLPFAEGSPIRGAIEDDCEGTSLKQIAGIDPLALLVLKGE